MIVNKWRRRVGIALACCLMLLPASSALCENRALIIGVGDYAYNSNGLTDLPGIHLDVNMMKDVADLMGFTPGQIKILRDEQATSTNIENTISRWLGGAGRDDKVLLYYSGHGTVMPDESGDEKDGNDEVILGHTTRVVKRNGRMTLDGVVVDDRMNELLGNLQSKDVLVMFDSCHSGTASKGLVLDVQTRNMNIDRLENKFFYYPGMPSSKGITATPTSKEGENIVYIGACRDNETSQASSQGSFFTLGVRDAIQKAAANKQSVTAINLHENASGYIRRVADSSNGMEAYHPQISGNSRLMNKNIFLADVSNGTGPGWRKLEDLYRQAGDKSLNLNVKKSYRIGDPFEVSVDVERSGYLYLLYVDAKDEITMLYPNTYNPEGRVQPGRVTIPGPKMNFDLTIVRPPGKHQVVALWASERTKAFESGKKSIDEVFAVASEKSMDVLMRGVKASSRFNAGREEFTVR